MSKRREKKEVAGPLYLFLKERGQGIVGRFFLSSTFCVIPSLHIYSPSYPPPIFVKSIFRVLFFETCENKVPTKIVTEDLDSPRRIL